MLYQLHHQFKDHTEMVAQKELNSQADMENFFQEISKSHPLPEKALWLMVPEDSPRFVKTKTETM